MTGADNSINQLHFDLMFCFCFNFAFLWSITWHFCCHSIQRVSSSRFSLLRSKLHRCLLSQNEFEEWPRKTVNLIFVWKAGIYSGVYTDQDVQHLLTVAADRLDRQQAQEFCGFTLMTHLVWKCERLHCCNVVFNCARVFLLFFAPAFLDFRSNFDVFLVLQWPDNRVGCEFAVHWLCGAATHLGQAHIAVETTQQKSIQVCSSFCVFLCVTLSVSVFLFLFLIFLIVVCLFAVVRAPNQVSTLNTEHINF